MAVRGDRPRSTRKKDGEGGRPRASPRRGIAKITRPQPAEVLRRERLFARLDQCTRSPLVWVSAPAGSGKTTLLATYVAARDLDVLWYQVDSGDEDLASFFHYLGLAGHQAAPRRRKPLPHLTPEYLLGIPEFSRNFFEALFHRLKSPSLVIFDDVQEVGEDAPLHAALLEGLNRLREGVSVACLSRLGPPPAYARLLANRQLAVVGGEELRLTDDELRDFAAIHSPEDPSQLLSGELCAKMDGWVAGFQLLLQAAKRHPLGTTGLGAATAEDIFAYFQGEVFGHLEEETRAFLLRTSFLPALTAEMAESLAGAGARRILADLHRRNLFTERLSAPAPSYRYHPLFRDFLLHRAAQELPPEELARLQREAGSVLRASGHPDAAIELFRSAGDSSGMARLILEEAPSLIRQGRSRRVEEWIDSLPGDLVETSPWLLYWKGTCRMPRAWEDARRHFEKAFELFRGPPEDPAGALLAWSGVVDSLLRGLDSFSEIDRWIATLWERGQGPDALLPAGASDRVVATMYHGLVVRGGPHTRFDTWEARALEVAQHTPDPNLRAEILTLAARHRIRLGQLAEAEALLDWPGQPPGEGPLGAIRHLLARAELEGARGHFDEAGALVRQALALGESSGVRVLDAEILVLGTFAAVRSGRAEVAKSLLGTFLARPGGHRRWDACQGELLRAALLAVQGDLAGAEDAADRALDLAQGLAVDRVLAACHLLLAEIAIACGRSEASLAHVRCAGQLAEQCSDAPIRLGSELVEARLGLESKGTGSGSACLGSALAFGRERGNLFPDLCLPGTLTRIVATAVEAGVEPEYARLLAERYRLSLGGLSAEETGEASCALKIYTLGRFAVVRNGVPLKYGKKAPRKPLALLKVLISLGGRKASRVRLMDALWPDADGDRAVRSLGSTVHRLRRLLRLPEAVLVGEEGIGLDARHCWVDAWAFEQFLRQDERGSTSASQTDPERALALYGGAFLPGEEEAWAVPTRERLRSKFLGSVERHGLRLEESRKTNQAAELYRDALAAEPLAEGLYRRLMICCGELGQTAEALAVYERCRSVLGSVLHAKPSAETEHARQSLDAPAVTEPSEGDRSLQKAAHKVPVGSTPFVGRETELEVLQVAFERARSGSAQAVALVGETGVGKSRLLREFLARLPQGDYAFFQGRCHRFGAAMVYAPIAKIVRACLGIGEDDPVATIGQRVSERMGCGDPARAKFLPPIQDLLSLGVEDPEYLWLDPRQRKTRLFEAVQELVGEQSRDRTLVLALEDLHWLDGASEELLHALLSSPGGAHLLWVLVYRPEYRPPWQGLLRVRALELAPLRGGSRKELVRRALADGEVDAKLLSYITRRARGNPLFTEELILNLRERGQIQRAEGRYLLSERLAAEPLPETIRGAIAERIDRSGEELRQILQAASVLGGEFTLQILSALVGQDDDLQTKLLRLQAGDFLSRRRTHPRGGYAFHHPLLEEAAYDSLHASRRAELHERAGSAIESLYADRLEFHYELLAHHYTRAGNAEKALRYLELANGRAARLSAMRQAKDSFDEALRLLDTLPNTDAHRRRRVALLVDQMVVFQLLFAFPEYYGLLARHEAQARGLDDPGLVGAFYARKAGCEWAFGHFQTALHTARDAAGRCETAGNFLDAAHAYIVWQWSQLYLGDLAGALARGDDVLRMTARHFFLRWHVWALACASRALSYLGRWEEAAEQGYRALGVAREFADDSLVSFSEYTLCLAFTHRGVPERAVEYGLRAVEHAPTPADRAWSEAALAWARCRSGDLGPGIEALARLLSVFRQRGYRWLETQYGLCLGEAYAASGDLDRARATIEPCLAAAKASSMRYYEGWGHRLLGEVLRTVDPSQASRQTARGVAILGEIHAAFEPSRAHAAARLI